MSDPTNNINQIIQNEEEMLAMLDLISKALTALPCDTDEIQEMVKKVKSKGQKNLELQNGLLKDFLKLKESTAETEEKLAQMRKNLDELNSTMSLGDYKTNEALCEQRYASVWQKLDETSKSFLVTASFLCRRCVGESIDFSPMIVEMSRAYENELLEKIFRDFVQNHALSASLPRPVGKDALFDAVNDAKNGRPFFISLTQMIKIIKHMPQSANNTYGGRLYTDLDPNWDTIKLSDRRFYQDGITYATDYRNRAAHPGTTLRKGDADDCERLSQSLLNHFIGSMKQ